MGLFTFITNRSTLKAHRKRYEERVVGRAVRFGEKITCDFSDKIRDFKM